MKAEQLENKQPSLDPLLHNSWPNPSLLKMTDSHSNTADIKKEW